MVIQDLRLSQDFKFFCDWSWADPFTNQKLLITEQHLKLVETLMSNSHTACTAYRWFGKSSIITFKYALWRATQHKKTIVIFSATEDLAADKLKIIKTSIETDPNLAKYNAKGIFTWKDNEIRLTDKSKVSVDDNWQKIYPVISRIRALWFDSKIRWHHYDIVLLDDIITEENTLNKDWSPNPDKIKATKFQFKTKVVPILNPGGNFIFVWTPQHWVQGKPDQSDLLYERMNKKTVKSFFLPAFNEQWQPNCPELHSLEFLTSQKSLLDEEAWNKEYMLNPVKKWDRKITQEIINKSIYPSYSYLSEYVPRPKEVMILGTDYAVLDDENKAQATNSAYFALVPIAYNVETQKRSIKDIYYKRWLWFLEQLNLTWRFIQQYNINVVAMETHWGMRYFFQELQHMIKGNVELLDASNYKSKFDRYIWLPSLLHVFEKWLYELAFQTEADKEATNFLAYELVNMSTATHVDVADAILRAETVITKNYKSYYHDPNFSLRHINKDKKKTKLTKHELAKMSTWWAPTQRELDKALEKKEHEHALQSLTSKSMNVSFDIRDLI
jgi:hypothetical protein